MTEKELPSSETHVLVKSFTSGKLTMGLWSVRQLDPVGRSYEVYRFVRIAYEDGGILDIPMHVIDELTDVLYMLKA